MDMRQVESTAAMAICCGFAALAVVVLIVGALGW